VTWLSRSDVELSRSAPQHFWLSPACSGSVSINQEKTVAKADVADQISTKVNEKAGSTNLNR